jgi:hypothetical protein
VTKRSAALVSFVAVLALVAPACKPKAGGSCRPSQSMCEDGTKALYCKGGSFATATCGGPLGCKKVDNDLLCDQSESSPGSACLGEDDRACTKDKKQVLACRNGSFAVVATCKGKKGCSPLGKMASCDATIADRNDPCEKDGEAACSSDGRTALKCTLHKWEVARFCRGGGGCTNDEDSVVCDESIAEIDDPCAIPGRLACSSDKKNELICQGGRFALSRACKNQCKISPSGHTVKCE